MHSKCFSWKNNLATIFASGSKKMTEGFGPKIPGFDHFIFGNHQIFEEKY